MDSKLPENRSSSRDAAVVNPSETSVGRRAVEQQDAPPQIKVPSSPLDVIPTIMVESATPNRDLGKGRKKKGNILAHTERYLSFGNIYWGRIRRKPIRHTGGTHYPNCTDHKGGTLREGMGFGIKRIVRWKASPFVERGKTLVTDLSWLGIWLGGRGEKDACSGEEIREGKNSFSKSEEHQQQGQGQPCYPICTKVQVWYLATRPSIRQGA